MREREKSNAEALHCNTEKEIEKEKEKELDIEKKRTPSSFSDKKKGGRYGTKNNFYNNSYYGKNKSPEKPSSYNLEAVLKEDVTNKFIKYDSVADPTFCTLHFAFCTKL